MLGNVLLIATKEEEQYYISLYSIKEEELMFKICLECLKLTDFDILKR